MRDGLNAAERPSFFALCGRNPWYAPYGASLGNSWRVAMEVNKWYSLWNAVGINVALAAYAGLGGWNGLDALVGSRPGSAAIFAPRQVRTQFSLWVVMVAPLMIGTSPWAIVASNLNVYKNTEVIAMDQDPLGIQGSILWEDCPLLPLPPQRDLLEFHIQLKTVLQGIPANRSGGRV